MKLMFAILLVLGSTGCLELAPVSSAKPGDSFYSGVHFVEAVSGKCMEFFGGDSARFTVVSELKCLPVVYTPSN